MSERMYPLAEEVLNARILPIIWQHSTLLDGRSPKVSHYNCFCAMLKMLKLSVPWRDCPKEYALLHIIYTRLKRWGQNCLLWTILYELKQKKLVEIEIIFKDSTTVKVHRHAISALKKEDYKV